MVSNEVVIPETFAEVAPAMHLLNSQSSQFVVIRSPETFTAAGEFLKAVKSALKQIEDQRVKITKPANDIIKTRNAEAKMAAAPFLALEQSVKAALVNYTNEQERIRREEQRKADEAARAERAKIEKQRIEAERVASAKAAAQRALAEEMAAKGDEAAAARARAKADSVEEKAAAKSSALEERQAAVVAPVIVREAPKVAGLTFRDVVEWEVTDPDLIPREYMSIDEVKIGKVVKALKLDTPIPGIRVWMAKQPASGAA